MKKNYRIWFLSVIIPAYIIGTSAITGCKKPAAVPATAPVEEEVIYAVTGYKTSVGNLDDYLEFGGDVSSVSAVDVIPDMAGKISSIKVNVGDMVRKDDVIAYVDASRPGMNYKASPVKAPISGRIISFTPMLGATVSQAMAIAKISNTDELEIKMSVPERFISRIHNNQTASIAFDAYPGVVFYAQIHEVSPVLDTSTRTMDVKLRMMENDDRIKVGMFARIHLVTETVKNATVIPAASIITRDGKPYVFVISSDSANASLRSVTVGMTVDNKSEIISGLSEGEVIVVKGQSLLNDGAKINVISMQE
ncbi:MAG: efflux RND transporter periplasmic adaptor subunit [Treponema sp.]|nr:efflux RND transporter periplasmic adaptor subunit [Treponema sp.]